MSNILNVVVLDKDEPIPIPEPDETTPVIPDTGDFTSPTYESISNSNGGAELILPIVLSGLLILSIVITAIFKLTHKNDKLTITSKKFGIFSVVLLFSIAGFGALVANYFKERGVFAEDMSIITTDTTIEVKKGDDPVYAKAKAEITINDFTTDGYDLYVYAPEGNILTTTDNTEGINPVAAMNSPLDINNWGAVNSTDDTITYSDAIWNPVSDSASTPLLLTTTNEYTEAGTKITIYYGVYVDPGLPAGTYSANIEYSLDIHPSTRYRILFNTDDPAVTESMRLVPIGQPVGELPSLTKEYHTFAGWYTAEEGGERVTADTILDDNVSLYPRWDRITYDITFNPGEGTIAEQDATRTINAGTSIGALPAVSRENYDFLGWYTAAEGGEQITADTVPALTEGTTITYYAHYNRITYTIIFNPGAGTITSGDATMNVNAGNALGELPVAHQDYFTFIGWYTAAEGGDYINSDTVPSSTEGRTITYYAQYSQNTISVTFNAGAGTISEQDATRTINAGSKVGILPTPTLTNYDFIGWYTAEEGGEQIDENTIPESDEVTYYARYSIIVCTVTFDAGEGTIISGSATKNVNSGEALGELPVASLANHDFAGWFTAAEGGEVVTTEDIITARTVTYYAHYTKAHYTITFNANGGTISEQDTTRTIEAGTSLNTLPETTKEFNTFAGWWTALEGGEQINENTIPESTTTYYAHWNAITYDITFNPNGGTISEQDATRQAVAGQPLGTLPTPEKEDYDFTGWYTAAEDGTLVDENTVPDQDATYYAHWTKITYTITFNANGGTVSEPTRTIEKGAALGTLPTPEYTKHDFEGWWTAASGGEQIDEDTIPAPAEGRTVTYYAHWSATTFTVTFDPNGGSFIDASKATRVIDAEAEVGALPTEDDVTYTNYNFLGWYTKRSGGVEVRADDVPTSDVTYYARWERIAYTITFNGNGGNVVEASRTVLAGNAIGDLHTATRENYTFNGWYTAVSGGTKITSTYVPTGSNTNIIVYARWTAVSFQTVWSQTGACTFTRYKVGNETHGSVSGDECADYAGQEYIDTGISLYSSTNLSKDYEIGFTIVSYDPNEQEKQSTLMNTKYEGSIGGGSYPGLVFRRYETGSKFELGSRQTTGANTSVQFESSAVSKVRIIRSGGSIYYVIDNGTLDEPLNTPEFNPSFDLNVWFGAAPKNAAASSAQRFLTGTLSNMYIKLGTFADTRVVTFDPNGGTVNEPTRNVNLNSQIGELPLPVLDGYTFTGWYTAKEGGTKISSTTTISSNVTYYAHWEVKSFTISFKANGGNVNETTRKVPEQEEIGELPKATKRDYVNTGWFTAATGGEEITSSYVPTEDMNVYASYDLDVSPLNGITYFQDFTTLTMEQEQAVLDSMATDIAYSIKDKRDNKEYTIIKLAGDRLFMRENLKLDARKLTPEDSDVSAEYNMPTTAWVSSSQNYYCKAIMASVNGEYYYNWYAATANPYECDNPTSSNNATTTNDAKSLGSICPAGWALPDYSLDITPSSIMNNGYNPGNINKVGNFYNGTLQDSGSYGSFWSSARYSNDGAYRVYQSNGTAVRGSTGKNYGDSVRCMRKGNTITFNANGGSLSISKKNLRKGIAVGDLPIPTKENYNFSGWYTALTDGTKVTKEYIPTTDTILYAHWETSAPEITGITYFQDFATLSRENEINILASMETNQPYLVKDKRDNKEYTITKLNNGYLWMREDLKLDSTDNGVTRRLTPEDSDVSEAYDMPTEEWTSSEQNYYCKAIAASNNGKYYYNWYAAKANPYECDNPTSYTNATAANDAKSLGSICPAGWTLPNYSNDITASVLYGNYSNYGNLITTGYFHSGAQNGVGSYGYFWSSARYSNDYAFFESFSSSNSVSREYTVKYYGYSVRCMRDTTYKISFDTNGGSSDITKRNVIYGDSLGTLPEPTRTNFTFTGWYTSVVGGEKVTEEYVPTSDIILYAHWTTEISTITGATYFQDFTTMTAEQEQAVLSSMETNTPYVIRDQRDNKDYLITKLSNGYLYMYENLKLDATTDGTTARVLTPTDSDVSSNFTMPASWSDYYYCKPAMAVSGGEYYYNWYAAKANPYECDNPTSYANATEINDAKSLGSICPAGWTLPDYNTDITASVLYGDSTNYANLTKAGYYSSGSVSNKNSQGRFWSSVRYNDYSAHYEYINNSNSVSRNENSKYFGNSVRCMRDNRIIVSFNANSEESAVAQKRLQQGDNIGTLTMPTKTGYNFTGWYTTLDGGEKITENFIPASNITLYAHWDQITTLSVTYFQDFATMTAEQEQAILSSMEANASYTIKDKRDDKDYLITKLSNGYLYMRENLKLDATTNGITARVLTPTDSDVSSNFTMPTESWTSSSQNYYCKAIMATKDGEYYYNWYAAKANPYQCSNPTSYTNATATNDAKSLGSICPAGWTLPDYKTDIPTSVLYNGSTNYGNLTKAGYFYSSSVGSKDQGYFWSSVRSSDNYAYHGLIDSSNSVGRNNGNKSFGFSVRCMRDSIYTISFNMNGGNGNATKKTIAQGDGLGALPTSTRTNFTFAGWYTSAIGGEKVTEEYVPTGSITLYAHWTTEIGTITGVTYFQDFTTMTAEQEFSAVSSMKTNTPYFIKDQRDGKDYLITKLSNGYLYMYENLRLDSTTDGTTARVLTPTDSDVSSNFTMPTESWTSSSQDYYCKAIMAVSGGEYYYNWYAAKANPYECDNPTSSTNATAENDVKSLGSICPAGWTLPDYGADITASALYSDSTNYGNLTRAGVFSGGSVSSKNSYGDFWSSTRYDNYYAYREEINSSNSVGRSNANKTFGFSVRCMRDTTLKILFNNNGGTDNTTSRKIAMGEKIGTLPELTRANFTFTGWYTSVIGGEKVTEEYVPTSDIILYAHWTTEISTITGATYFQDFTTMTAEQEQAVLSSMETNTPYVIRDQRDNKDYLITKLSNGYLYMYENLKLDATTDGTTARVLTPTDSDVSSNFTMPTASWGNYYCRPVMTTKDGEYYYNWYAAKANPYQCSNPTSETNATLVNDAKSLGSICPAGWTLPDYSTDITASVLYSDSTNYGNLTKAGYYSGSVGSKNSDGYFWSSVRHDDSRFAYREYINSSNSVGRDSAHKYYGFSVRCMRDNRIIVSFNANSEESAVAQKRLQQGDNIGPLTMPTKTGYNFTGWYTALDGGEKITEEYVPTSNIIIYAHWSQITTPGVTYFQDFATMTAEQEQAILSSMEANASYTIKDKRDDKDYLITKLSNGYLYMRENLKLDATTNGITARVLTPTDSDVSSNFTMPTESWTSSSQNYYCKAIMATSNGEYYYNWYAAKANPYECSDPTSTTNATETNDAKSLGSICPAGWTLPNYSTDIPASILYNNSTNYGNLTKAGRFFNGSVSNKGSQGSFWSSTRQDNYYAYYEYIISSNSVGHEYNNKYYGRSVRCARLSHRITLDANGGSVSIQNKDIPDFQNIGNLPTASRKGYEFIGWYTSVNDGELVADDFVPTGNITLYAHWRALSKTIDNFTYMQDLASLTDEERKDVVSSMTVNTAYTLKDKRDEKEYTITKLSNGYLYMRDNLKLDSTTNGTTARVLTPTDSDVSSNFTMPTVAWSNSYYNARMVVSGTEYYYNWYAAKANPNTTSSYNDSASLGSICPAGWTLPDYSTDIPASVLYNSSTNYGNLTKNGYYYNGSITNDNSAGYFWSSTSTSNNSGNAYYETINSSNSVSRNSFGDVYGLSIRCMFSPAPTVAVTYDPNGGSVSTSKQNVLKNFQIGVLQTATRDNYTFTGWYTALEGGERINEYYSPNANITLYAHWTPKVASIPGATYFQDFATMAEEDEDAIISSITNNTSYVIKDKRDEKEYIITKLSNGYLYMRENLRLDATTDGTNARVLAPTDSDVSSNFTMPTESWTSSSKNYYCKAIMATSNGEYYYNWYTAKANPYECNNPTSYTNATTINDAKSLGSICPAGWTLPDYSTDIPASVLYNSSTNYGNLTKAGYFYNGSVSNKNSQGYFWSSARHSSDNRYAYYEYINSSNSVNSNNNYKYYGYSVRCMRDVKHVISFNANGGIIGESNRIIHKGVAIGSLPVPEHSAGYTFAGWYTALDGGEEITESYIPAADMTIYAHWEFDAESIQDVTYFQDFATMTAEQEAATLASLETNAVYTIKDKRDEKEYTITKLSNGRLYMTANLKLDATTNGTTARVLTPTDSDVSSNFTMPTESWTSSSQNYYCKAIMATSNGEYYYNWYAAKANPYQCSNPTSYTNAIIENDARSLGSICPAGWTLPDYETDITANVLYGNSTNYAGLTKAGRYYNGSVGDKNSQGFFWSSVRSNTNYAYYEYIYSSNSVGRGDIYKYYGNSVRCMRDDRIVVSFNTNNGDSVVAQRRIQRGSTIGDLNIPNRAGYNFTGWYTALDGGEKITENYTPISNTTLYAHWEEVEGFTNVTYFQDFATMTEEQKKTVLASMDMNVYYTIKDKRDEKEYNIVKLSNGSLYMAENLKLDATTNGTTVRILTPTDSDVSSNFTMPTESWTSSSQNYYCKAIMATSNGEYYYNWYAAKANSYGCGSPTSSTNATETNDAKSFGSICPAGWTLPDYETDITASVLYSDSNNYGNLTRAGYFYNGSVSNKNSYGYFWSNARASDTSAYREQIIDSDLASRGYTSKYYGSSVRCMLNFTYTLSFDNNNGTGTVNAKKVTKGEKIDVLPVAQRDGYFLDGWYTAATGGTKITEGYIPTSDMTLYAHWVTASNLSTISNITYFQDFSNLTKEQETATINSMVINKAYKIIDKRDNKVYAIARLQNNRLYMFSNLRLDSRVLTPTDSDVSSNFTMPDSWSNSGYYSRMATSNGEYYYNWYAATANPNTTGNYNDSASLGSICPAGWTLPDYNTDIPASVLYNSSTNYGNLTKAGYFYSSSVNNKDSQGYFWSSVRSSDYYAYYESINSSNSVSRSYAYKYYGYSVRCMRDAKYRVTFNSNGGESKTTSRKITMGEKIGTLPELTRANFTFAGWYTSVVGGEKVTEEYVPTGSITLYAHWTTEIGTITGVTYFQDFATMTTEQELSVISSMETNTPYVIRDQRDNKDYLITKLSNGYLYMYENLKLDATTDGTTARVLTPTDSDVSSNFTMPTESWTSSSRNYYCKAIMATSNGEYYYNWYAAKANPYQCSNPTSEANATAENDAKSLGSICPAGWTLPDYSADITASALYSDSTNYGNLTRAGYYSGSVDSRNSDGYFWSSARHSSDNRYAYYEYINSSNSVSRNYNHKYYGYSVRCMRDTTYKISFNSNGGESNTTRKTITMGEKIGTLPELTRANFTFAGWYTSVVGGEKVTEEYVPTSDIILYAHWTTEIGTITGVTYFQDFATMTTEQELSVISSMETNTPYVIRDQRDNKDYLITKLSNGYLYMYENLKLDATTDGTTARVLTPTDSDVSSNFTMSTESWNNEYYRARMAISDGEYYYNWYAAKANPNTTSSYNDSASLGSICPAGWTLPDYSTDITASALYSDSTNYGNLTKAGYFNNRVHSKNSDGYFWSSARYSNSSAYNEYIYSSNSVGRDYNNNYYGYSVRCMRDTTLIISFNNNGGTHSTTSRKIAMGEKIGTLPEPTRVDYSFIGWYTALDGGEKVAEEYVPTGNITLYAHWMANVDSIPGVTYFQDFVNLTNEQEAAVLSNMTVNKPYVIKDIRDSKEYLVIKLSNKHLFMAENLKLDSTTDGTTARVLTSTDSDVSSNFTMPTASWSDYYCKSAMAVSGGEYYYNWYTATANPYECDNPTSYANATLANDAKSLGSICPAGWTLPDYSADIPTSVLYSNSTNYGRLTMAGYFYNGYVSNKNSEGLFWSSARYDNSQAYYEYINSSNSVGRSYGNKHYGRSVRCMRYR